MLWKKQDEFLKRPWCVNTRIKKRIFVKKFKDRGRIIYKPCSGNRGKGVEAFDIDKTNAGKIYEQLKEYPKGVVEGYVVQHPAISELAPSSVNTIRIVCVASNSELVTADGKHMEIAYTSIRIGGGTSVVDSFHGGMVAGVDLETGEVVTDATDMEGNVYKEHPLTGVKIRGFMIPYFEEALNMVREAQEKSKFEGYLGWDVAITEEGPFLIEINLKPAAALLTTPFVVEGKGTKHIMEKYM